MRRESYVMFQIPKLNKTILVNNCYGEATFIYDGILEYDDVVAYSKKDLSSQLTKIIFSHSKKETWDVQILGELTRIKQEVKEKREKGELSEPKSVKEIFKAKFIECLKSKFGKNVKSFTDEDKEKLVMMAVEERRESFQITV